MSALRGFLAERRPWPRPETVLAALGLCLLLGLVWELYAPTLNDAFHGDDFVAFLDFKTKSLGDYSRDVIMFKDSNFYWRPLGDIFHHALYDAFGFNTYAFRVAALACFLGSMACIYAFCRGENLGRLTALGAVLAFGVLPNHALSVSWVTNTSRLMAGLLFLVCLLLLQHAGRARDDASKPWPSRFRAFGWEAGAFLAFVAACMCDEVTVALAPIAFLYGTFLARRKLHIRASAARLVFYAAVVAVIVPLQFTYTIDDEQRLNNYGPGEHITESVWTLASLLTLPIASGSPVDEGIHLIPEEEWAAGPVLLAACGLLFLAGSRLTRFCVVWLAAALAPFALWEPQYLSSRYVYLAAMPFSILASWCAVYAYECALSLTRRLPRMWRPAPQIAISGAALAGVIYLGVMSYEAVEERNAAWSRETAKYGVLRSALEEAAPSVAPGTRIVIGNGKWTDFWASAVAKSLYGDKSIWVVSVPPERTSQIPGAVNQYDLVFYLVGDKLTRVPLPR